MSYFFRLLILILILMKLFNLLKSNICLNKNNYDHLILNLQWPSTFVEHNKRRLGNLDVLRDHKTRYGYLFTIHGLWPQNTFGRGPTNCYHSDTFIINNIKTIANIDKYWTSFGMPTTDFWRYEWRKHGSCAAVLEKMTTVEDYFRFTIEKAEDFNNRVFQTLKNELKPSNIDFYNAVKIKSTIEKAHGFKITLKCWAQYISSIEICFNKDLKPINCLDTFNYTPCNGDVILPA